MIQVNENMRPILDYELNETGTYVDNKGNFYREDRNGNVYDPSFWMPDNSGHMRQYVNCNLDKKGYRAYSAPRLQAIAFGIVQFTYNFYSNLEVDHLDGDCTNNDICNLDFCTHKENMRRYAINKRGCNSYSDELIYNICQDICNNLSRKDIIKKYNINGQLIDDIKAGRSHKDISSKFLNCGFKYTNYNRDEYNNLVTEICKLLEKGEKGTDIQRKLGLPNPCFIYDIKHKRKGVNISKNFNI